LNIIYTIHLILTFFIFFFFYIFYCLFFRPAYIDFIYLCFNGYFLSSFISLVLSFLISNFVLNKFKYSDNLIINEGILQKIVKGSKHSVSDSSRIPSPDNSFINCCLEKGELSSPLEKIFYDQFVLNVFILILLIVLLIIIFNRFVLKSNLNFISSYFDKYMPIKIKLKKN
jgi:hypothetical protein